MSIAVKSLALRRGLQAIGLLAFSAGVWCCWLADRKEPVPPESEAFHEWQDTAAPRRLTAAITDITPVSAVEDEHHVVISADFESSEDEPAAIEQLSHEQSSDATDVDIRHQHSAWLTGTIEDEDDEAHRPANTDRKRTLKSASKSKHRSRTQP